MIFLKTLSTCRHRCAEYRRTTDDLRNMHPEVALDLDIAREDAGPLARRAVYG